MCRDPGDGEEARAAYEPGPTRDTYVSFSGTRLSDSTCPKRGPRSSIDDEAFRYPFDFSSFLVVRKASGVLWRQSSSSTWSQE